MSEYPKKYKVEILRQRKLMQQVFTIWTFGVHQHLFYPRLSYTHKNKSSQSPGDTNEGLNNQKIALSGCSGFSSGRTVGFSTSSRLAALHMDCSATPAQGERGMLYALRVSVSGKTLHRPEINKEKKRPIQEDILIRSFFLSLPSAISSSIMWGRTIWLWECECDPEKHWADPSAWTSFIGAPWPWQYANAAGCWHRRHGLDAVWLLLCCSLTWLCFIVSLVNSRSACSAPHSWIWREF